MFWSKTKIFVTITAVLLLTIFVLAVPSDDWNCYNTAEGWCKCERSSSGGEGLCIGTYDDPNDPLVFTTYDRQTSPITPQCMAVVDCIIGGQKSCAASQSCEAYYDDDGFVKCDGQYSWC